MRCQRHSLHILYLLSLLSKVPSRALVYASLLTCPSHRLGLLHKYQHKVFVPAATGDDNRWGMTRRYGPTCPDGSTATRLYAGSFDPPIWLFAKCLLHVLSAYGRGMRDRRTVMRPSFAPSHLGHLMTLLLYE